MATSIDVQPETDPKVGPCSLTHYQRVDKKCISLQILPYSRPYVLPFSKVLNSESFASVISTLPEAGTPDAAEVTAKLEDGRWRIVDEAGLLIRIQDWEDLAGADTLIILDTDGGVKREAERVDTAPAAAAEKTKDLSADIDPEVSETHDSYKPDAELEEVPRLAVVEDDEEKEEKVEKERPQAEVPDKEPIEKPVETQGDPEWGSWDTSHPTSPPDAAGWTDTGPVAPRDDGWGGKSAITPREAEWGSSSNSTFHNRENGSTSSRFSRQTDRENINNSPYYSHKPYPSSNPKPHTNRWQIPRSTSPNGFSKNKFPKKVHLTFYAPFKLPRGVPPTPQPLYNRFSVTPDTPMQKVALKVLSRHPFSNMPTPSSPEFEPENHVFVFLELREEYIDGKRMFERGRVMKVLGRTSIADIGLSTEGGLEGLGRYYFIVKDFFAEGMDFDGIDRN